MRVLYFSRDYTTHDFPFSTGWLPPHTRSLRLKPTVLPMRLTLPQQIHARIGRRTASALTPDEVPLYPRLNVEAGAT
jgi:hypothetical protein